MGGLMFCPKCGARNKYGAQFCDNCGSALPIGGTPYQPTGGVPGVEYAGFWLRFVAYIIDGIIMSLISIPILALVLFPLPEDLSIMAPFAASILIQWLYFAGLESSSRQATLGKGAVGIIVTDLDGERISLGKATVRYFSKILSSMVFCIGYLMIGFTEKKQGLHDMIAGCLVIKK